MMDYDSFLYYPYVSQRQIFTPELTRYTRAVTSFHHLCLLNDNCYKCNNSNMNNKELEKKVINFAISLVYEKGYVCSVDMLLKLEYLTKDNYEAWRFGRIPYLEKVCTANLSKLSLINKEIRKIASDLKLHPSSTTYNKYGKGVKQRLIFSKSGDRKIEEAYATHYLDRNRIDELKAGKGSA